MQNDQIDLGDEVRINNNEVNGEVHKYAGFYGVVTALLHDRQTVEIAARGMSVTASISQVEAN